MKYIVSCVCFLSVFVFVSSAPFLPEGAASASLQLGGETGGGNGGGGSGNASSGGGGLTNILSQIDLPGLLRGVNSFVKLVGVFCPPLSQVLDNVIQNVTSTAFRVFGRIILQGGGGLGGGNSGNGGGQKVSVVLPTFPPDEDDEDYDEDEDNETDTSNTSSAPLNRTDIRFGTDSDTNTDTSETTENVTSSSADESTVTNASLSSSYTAVSGSDTDTDDKKSDVEATPTKLYTSPADDDSNLIAKRHVRVAREADDQQGAESAPQPSEELSDVDIDDQDRNKRFLPFGGSVEGHGSSGGGSGNFLFDIIRVSKRAAIMAGH